MRPRFLRGLKSCSIWPMTPTPRSWKPSSRASSEIFSTTYRITRNLRHRRTYFPGDCWKACWTAKTVPIFAFPFKNGWTKIYWSECRTQVRNSFWKHFHSFSHFSIAWMQCEDAVENRNSFGHKQRNRGVDSTGNGCAKHSGPQSRTRLKITTAKSQIWHDKYGGKLLHSIGGAVFLAEIPEQSVEERNQTSDDRNADDGQFAAEKYKSCVRNLLHVEHEVGWTRSGGVRCRNSWLMRIIHFDQSKFDVRAEFVRRSPHKLLVPVFGDWQHSGPDAARRNCRILFCLPANRRRGTPLNG